MNSALGEYLRDRPKTQEERHIAYNAFLMSFDKHELDAYFKANELVAGTQQSLELYCYDCCVIHGTMEVDEIGAKILVLLGEL